MINPIISQIQTEIWMMEPRAMSAMFGKLFTIEAESLAHLSKIEIQKTAPAMRIEGSTAVINIHGVLMKDPPNWLAWFGIESTDYNQIRKQLTEAVGNTNIQSIMLHVNSPGGTVAGTSETAEAIEAANNAKPVTAYIEDLGASAAYLLASQAKEITANINAEVGSIGTYTVYDDYSKAAEIAGVKIVVIRSGEHKGMGVIGAPITEEQIAAVQDVVNGMAANFKLAVSKGRKISAEAIEKLADGRVWLAAEAKKLGLIDNIVTGNEKQQSNNNNSKGQGMVEKETTATGTVDIEAVKKQADDAGKARLSALQTAFPDEPKFVLEQFTAGASVEQAKAAFCDVLKARNVELTAKNAELVKKKPASKGATPVPVGGEGGSQAGEFMELSRQYSEEHKCSMAEAMKKVRKKNQQAFDVYLKSCREQQVVESE